MVDMHTKEKLANDISNIHSIPIEESRKIVEETVNGIYKYGYAITWARHGQPK